MQMLKACNQETALGICDDIHLKYKEMQAQMDKTVVDLRSQRKQRLELERQQNKVVRYRQSRIQTLTRKLRQAKYDLQLVQAWNATHAQEVQLNYHTFQNPISWLLGDKPLFDRNTHKDGDGKNQLGYFIANRMVWVRTIGESEYRMGKILKVHPGIVASGKHHSHLHVAHEDDTYDILYDDGESETRVTKARIRAPEQDDQTDPTSTGMFCFPCDCCKGCGKQFKSGTCETCCGPCQICGCADCGKSGSCCGQQTSGQEMAKKWHFQDGNFSMRERAPVDPIPLYEQWMGHSSDQPSLRDVLNQFYHNMRKKALAGEAHISLVDPKQARFEVDEYWTQLEINEITLPDLNSELAGRFGGYDLNSVFEPLLEPMNRAG
jgi:hypothetical protein